MVHYYRNLISTTTDLGDLSSYSPDLIMVKLWSASNVSSIMIVPDVHKT